MELKSYFLKPAKVKRKIKKYKKKINQNDLRKRYWALILGDGGMTKTEVDKMKAGEFYEACAALDILEDEIEDEMEGGQ